MIAAFAAVVWAAPPSEGLRPVVARPGAADEYRAWLAVNGRPSADLACRVAWPGLAALCFRVWEPVVGDPARRARRWVSTVDLTSWGVSVDALRVPLEAEALVRITGASHRSIGGMNGEYLEIIDADGWSSAAILRPGALCARLGGPPMAVALPSDAVMLAWKPGDDQVDLAMTVGVHELFVSAETPVTEVVHLWDGSAWSAWAMTQPEVAPK